MQLSLLKQIWFMTRYAFYGLFLQSLLCSLLIAKEGNAQRVKLEDVKLSIELNEVQLADAFIQIEQEVGFNFVLKRTLLNKKKKVSVSPKEQSMMELLTYLSKELNVKFKRVNENIYVSARDNSQNENEDIIEQIFEEIEISGKVTDEEGEGLPGVNVIVKGTSLGTVTDVEGAYSLEVPDEESVLVFSSVGYLSEDIVVGNRTVIDLTMALDITALEEIVVIGYGSVKKSDLTGSVSSIKEKELTVQAVRNPIQSLTGLVAGVQVRQNSGAPGSNMSVLIRGGNSLLGGNEPLYVVDGFPVVGGVGNINPNDIESMEILKDASATAIYGSRGANGVILITTKEGKEGKTSVEYNGYYGIQKGDKFLDMRNAKEFAELANLRASNDGEAPYFSDSEIASFGEGTDWQDEIFQTASIQNHTLSVSGGNNKTKFNVSGNYFDQEGILINSDFKRYQLKTNFQHKISPDWKIFVDNILSRTTGNNLFSDNTSRGYGVLSSAITAPPTLSVYDDQGDYMDVRQYAFSSAATENPVALAREQKNLNTRNSLLLNLTVEGQLLKNLVFRSSFGVEYASSRNDYYSSTKLIKSGSGDARIRYGETANIVNENTLSYSKEFNKNHNVTILGGVTSQKTIGQSLRGSSKGYITDVLENNSLQSGSVFDAPTSGYYDYSILSYLGRLNYSYKGKYLITTSIRADGSSRFGSDNKWGYFPSAALAWRVSEEDFWDNFVSDFKIRGSWGKTGNTAIAPYQTLSTLSSAQVVFNNDIYIGYAPTSTRPNSGLQWETTEQFDIGMDIGLFDNQLSFTIDYYHKNTYNLLANVLLPTSTGFTSTTDNVGSIQNKGLEISAMLKVVSGAFDWDLGANISLNQNRVLSLSQGADILGAELTIPLNLSVNLVREDYPVGVFYGYKEDGLTEEGIISYVDLDDNGEINSLDRQVIGDPNPDYVFGINSFMNFKGFGLTILIDGVQGNDVFNFNNSYIADGFSFALNNVKDDLGNYWSVDNPNPNAKYPRISESTRYDVSDRYVEDGSYVRIKNIQLSYTFNGAYFEKSPFKNSQIYVGVQNLLTLTNYSGYSPEVNTTGGGISKGVDQTGYPIARTVMLGVRIKL